MQIPQEKDVIDKLVAWGTTHPLIRAMILTSSRTRPNGPVDLLSDYDLILAVSEVESFAFDDAWIFDYGFIYYSFRTINLPPQDHLEYNILSFIDILLSIQKPRQIRLICLHQSMPLNSVQVYSFPPHSSILVT